MTLTETIAEIERLLAEATPGPMKATSKLTDVDGIPHEAICSESKHCGFALTEEVNDAALIVALVNAAPQLIEAAKRAEKMEKALKQIEGMQYMRSRVSCNASNDLDTACRIARSALVPSPSAADLAILNQEAK